MKFKWYIGNKIDSIEEKVYRKGIWSSQVFDKFDDIAGVRVICEYISDVYFLLEYNKELHKNIKVEIQLRTSFQNGWAIKTHNLTYKRKTNLARDIAKQIKRLSDSIYEADVKAQELRNILNTNK